MGKREVNQGQGPYLNGSASSSVLQNQLGYQQPVIKATSNVLDIEKQMVERIEFLSREVERLSAMQAELDELVAGLGGIRNRREDASK